MLDAMGAFVYSDDVGEPSDRQIKKAGEAGVPSVGRTVGPAFTKRHEAPKRTETPLQSHACGVSSCGAEREPESGGNAQRLFVRPGKSPLSDARSPV